MTDEDIQRARELKQVLRQYVQANDEERAARDEWIAFYYRGRNPRYPQEPFRRARNVFEQSERGEDLPPELVEKARAWIVAYERVMLAQAALDAEIDLYHPEMRSKTNEEP